MAIVCKESKPAASYWLVDPWYVSYQLFSHSSTTVSLCSEMLSFCYGMSGQFQEPFKMMASVPNIYTNYRSMLSSFAAHSTRLSSHMPSIYCPGLSFESNCTGYWHLVESKVISSKNTMHIDYWTFVESKVISSKTQCKVLSSMVCHNAMNLQRLTLLVLSYTKMTFSVLNLNKVLFSKNLKK